MDDDKKATEEGLLGKYSKVATAIPNLNAPTPKNTVICVYTYDHDDRKDVMRIRDELRKMGFTSKIPYKADKATLENKYSVKRNTRISTYYE
jgi:histidyl-tRNA synthetase